MKRGSWGGRVYLVLCVLAIVLPIVWVLLSSLKESLQLMGDPWGLPIPPKWSNFGTAWVEGNIGIGFRNSLIATGTTLVVLLTIGSMAAYVFAHYVFPGRGVLYAVVLGGMMFPIFLVSVPVFLLLKQLGLLNTLGGLVLVYIAFSLPFTIFVMTGFFANVPRDLAEAAMIDGCGHGQTFWRVMFPLAKPGLIVAGVFNTIGLWNEYPLALVLLTDKNTRTLPLALADLSQTQQYQADWGALFAALVIVMTPMLIGYWLVKGRLKDAMAAGAVKG